MTVVIFLRGCWYDFVERPTKVLVKQEVGGCHLTGLDTYVGLDTFYGGGGGGGVSSRLHTYM